LADVDNTISNISFHRYFAFLWEAALSPIGPISWREKEER